ncbi:MAG: hypothetical protein BWK79_08270 [Beggiatoa sp. IS2]|nr:MAG: hypothetical protein BWK79_08270 [Beggiatoa sp. IS2]
MRNMPIQSTLSIIAVAILGYLSYAIWIGWEETLHAVWRLGMTGIGFVLSLSLLNYLLRFSRWQWYLSTVDHQDLPVTQSLRYYFAGFAFTTTPGKIGEMVRSVFLKQHAVSYPQSLSMFFVERLSDLLATLILGAFVLWHFDNYQQWIIVPVIGAILLLALIQQQNLLVNLQTWLTYRVSTRFEHLFDLILHSRILLKSRFLYGGLLLGLLAWGAEGIGFYYILQIVGIESSVFLAIGVYAMSLIIGALSFLPGGLGGTEVAMLFLLTAMGASHENALAVTLICRFSTLWFAVVLGALALMGLKFRPIQEDFS